MIRKSFSLKMYGCKITIIIDSDIEKHYVKLCKKFKLKYEEGNMEGAVVSGEMDLYYFLLSAEHLSHNVIAHELYHLVFHIIKDRGILDEEASAWLVGHLSEQVYNLIETKKLYPFNV